jgi:hypothetical protein
VIAMTRRRFASTISFLAWCASPSPFCPHDLAELADLEPGLAGKHPSRASCEIPDVQLRSRFQQTNFSAKSRQHREHRVALPSSWLGGAGLPLRKVCGTQHARTLEFARVSSLARYEKDNQQAEPQATFLEVEPRATRLDS